MTKEWSPRRPTGIIFKAGDVIVPETGTYPKDALDVLEHTGGELVASPLGGGSIHRFHPRHLVKYRFRVVTPEEMKLSWYPGEFGMEILPRHFKGWTTGLLWNGFATPSFEFEVVKAILDAMISATKIENLAWIDGYEYDPAQDAFIVRASNYPDDPDIVRGEWTEIPRKPSRTERIKLYPLGSGYWTWTEKARSRRKST